MQTQEITLEGIHFKIPDGYATTERQVDASGAGDVEDIDGTAKWILKQLLNIRTLRVDELEIQVGSKKQSKN